MKEVSETYQMAVKKEKLKRCQNTLSRYLPV
jgi:hypothetical protein